MLICVFHVKIVLINSVVEVTKVAFGDNGPRKKTGFEKLTLIVVILMVIVTLGGIVMSALGAMM